ncbi:hypothetical protein Ocin01_18813 [Orchesella cincta]|uniref:Transmembrane protein n=1 Tax=Orchesella cincta TaxID=48709 RepID=A0A1D2M4G1_ORCCI|nr:hypothetical protein Ocin01_18813 [Orchesella cincta]
MDRKKAKEWGSDLIRTRISRETYTIEERTWRDFKFWEWIFIAFALLSISISIGFCVFQLVIAIIDKEKYIFPVLVILNNIFSAYFLWNGVMEELPFKLLMQLVVKIIIWIFDLIYFLVPSKEAGEGEEPDPYKEIRDIRFYISSSMLFLTLITGTVVIYQYWTSNIAIFRTVGTEPKYVRMCKMWNFCQSMMLFDAVVFITVVFHLCNFPEFVQSYASFYLIPSWLIATVVYVLLGIKAGSLGLLLYISLFFTAGMSFLAHIALLISVVRVQLSYGMGLKQAVNQGNPLLSQGQVYINSLTKDILIFENGDGNC